MLCVLRRAIRDLPHRCSPSLLTRASSRVPLRSRRSPAPSRSRRQGPGPGGPKLKEGREDPGRYYGAGILNGLA